MGEEVVGRKDRNTSCDGFHLNAEVDEVRHSATLNRRQVRDRRDDSVGTLEIVRVGREVLLGSVAIKRDRLELADPHGVPKSVVGHDLPDTVGELMDHRRIRERKKR